MSTHYCNDCDGDDGSNHRGDIAHEPGCKWYLLDRLERLEARVRALESPTPPSL